MTDPDNRLVADALEAEWNNALQALAEAHAEYEHGRREDRRRLGEKRRERIRSLAGSFPRVFADPLTPNRERKRMARLLIKDVTIVKSDKITLGVRMRGGALVRLSLPRPLPAVERFRTPQALVDEIDDLLERYTDAEAAAVLRRRGRAPSRGGKFRALHVQNIGRTRGLRTRYQRLRARGLLTAAEMSSGLGVSRATINDWRRGGLLRGRRYNDRRRYLYEWPEHPPAPRRGARIAARVESAKKEPGATDEVQYAA